MKLEASGVNQYYGIGAILALGVIGGLGYYIYRSKKVEQPKQILNHTLGCNHRPTSLRWIKSFLYYKMDKKSIVNDLYQAAVISVLAVGYSMLRKNILKMTPPSVHKFDLEDMGKLVAIVAASEMTREYLIKQKILPDHIKMASVAMLIGGALANALAFTGSCYLFHRLSADNIDAERKDMI